MPKKAEEYDFKAIEAKWQKRWAKDGTFEADKDESREKYYILDMFPYPSGTGIHMGNGRAYLIGDVLAKFHRLRGKNVLRPMGWDAFGLPAENAAIQHNVHPADWTRKNIALMKQQMSKFGFGYDWRREIASIHPDYYRWTQWLFLLLYKHGLAYKKKALLNWCPQCATVLANEQVQQGQCYRCDSRVHKKEMTQWFFRITDYADRLLDNLEKLYGWPDFIKTLQANWIGKSHGTEIDFKIAGMDETITVFTTRPDTIYGCTYMVIAAEHPLVTRLVEGTPKEKEVLDFCYKVINTPEIERTSEASEKHGIDTGRRCINAATGKQIPIMVADYVLYDYGTGCVMAVPAHDTRDYAFAKKYGLEIDWVIEPEDKADMPKDDAFTGVGKMINVPEKYLGMNSLEFLEAITDVMARDGWGRRTITYRLRDWLISRQRYWGVPIPILYCEKCGEVPVPDEQLPVALPHMVDFVTDEISPLAANHDFVNTLCPVCGGPAKRETDTMDTFVCSSWYYLRYASPRYEDGPWNDEDIKYWLPLDQYIGGPEHATAHLIYFRFVTEFLFDKGYLPFEEPTENLLVQGIVFFGGHKMSKSKGNTVDPMSVIDLFGSDSTRMFLMFAGPPDREMDWEDHIQREPGADFHDYRMVGVEGSSRFINRVWRLAIENIDAIDSNEIGVAVPMISDPELHKKVAFTIKSITSEIGEQKQLNTPVALLMELNNFLMKWVAEEDAKQRGGPAFKSDFTQAIAVMVRMMSIYAPHIAEELWQKFGGEGSIFDVRWPGYDERVIAESTVTCAVQVMGKLRDTIEVAPGITEAELTELAAKSPNTAKHLEGKKIVKVIAKPPKLINFVVK